jgi:hypothetical protein
MLLYKGLLSRVDEEGFDRALLELATKVANKTIIGMFESERDNNRKSDSRSYAQKRLNVYKLALLNSAYQQRQTWM